MTAQEGLGGKDSPLWLTLEGDEHRLLAVAMYEIARTNGGMIA